MATRTLPIPLLPAGTIDLAGSSVDYHSLSRAQALALNDYEGHEADAEDWILACGLDISVEDARAWREAVTLEIGGVLVDAIVDISGLSKNGNGTGPKARKR